MSALALTVASALQAQAQREATVSGKYDYYLGENDNVTIKDAKLKAIEMAKSEAIKNEFGMFVASDFINTEVGANDEFSSYYIMDTSTSVKGEWLGDEEEPKVQISVGQNGDLCFSAQVKGRAREIKRAQTDLKWSVQRDNAGKKADTDRFDSGERFFVNFKSPADGYVAIYLITGDDETACLLPYPNDTRGRVQIKGGRNTPSSTRRSTRKPNTTNSAPTCPWSRTNWWCFIPQPLHQMLRHEQGSAKAKCAQVERLRQVATQGAAC